MGQARSRMARAPLGKVGDLEECASSSAVAPSILTSMPPHSSGSEAALLPFYSARSEGPEAASSVYYSTRFEWLSELRSKTETQLEFDVESETQLEFDVESSRSHWSEVSAASDDSDEQEPNSVVFESMKDHPQWGPLFRRQPYDQLEIGAKIGEGWQAEIFEAWVRRKYDRETRKRSLVLKVFKKGHSLVDLQRMWPLGIASAEFPSGHFAPGHIDNLCWPEGVHLMDDGRFAFIFQRYWGDLRKLIDEIMMERNGHPPFLEFGMTFHLIGDIAKGMRKLHEMGILHNDLKASSVLVSLSNEHTYAVVANFESSIGIMGTRFWRAPEVLLALKNHNFRQETFTQQTDVYSFAMTCYEIITGRIPFEDHPISEYDIVLRGERPMLPNDPPYSLLNNLVTKCWHQDPHQRPSFAEIIEELGSSYFSNVYKQRPYTQYPMARVEDGNWDAKMSPSNMPPSKRDDNGYYPPHVDFLGRRDSNIFSSSVHNDPFGRSESLHSLKWVSFKQKLVEKPNLYLSCHDGLPFVSSFEEHFHLQTIEECNVGVVFIWKFSFTSPRDMVDLVRMVGEAKRRSDFKILPVMLDVSLAELDDPEMQEHIRKKWDFMELVYPASIKARECAAAYEYIRSCECMVNTGPKDIEFLNLVFDRVRGLISAERNTENLKGIPPPISMKDSDTLGSSKIYKVKENSSPTLMMLQSTSVNDPDWSKNMGERKNKSAIDSDSDKGDGEEERMQCPPLKSFLSHDSAPKSQDDFQMSDALQLQLEAQQELEDLDKPDEICDTIIENDNLEGANDLHGNIKDDYEAFKDQLYEDIKRIDCIEEIAIVPINMMNLLHSKDIVILSFFDESKDIFEFYFKNREDMVSIVGVGLEHAMVILESGEVTIKEIIEEDWNQRWRCSQTNSCEKRKLFKMKAPTPSNAYEGLIHLDVEISFGKPLLWELTKYFSLRDSIETFVSKDIFVEYAQGVETSSSTPSKNQGKGSALKSTWGFINWFGNGGLQENGNEGSTSNQIEEGVRKGSEDTATIVKLQLLRQQLQLKDEQEMNPFPGTIKSNLQLQFINEGGHGKNGKEVQIIVGDVSFDLGRDVDHNQLPWYHEDLKVVFGLLNKDAHGYGEFKDGSFEPLEMRGGTVNMKRASEHGHMKGKESIGKGGVSANPHGVGLFGEFQQKWSSHDSGTELSERSDEVSYDDYTKGGLLLRFSVDEYRIVCDYSLPKEVPSLIPPPTRHFIDQNVKFQGTWLPMGDGGSSLHFVEYTLQATRTLCYEDKRYQHQQKYTKTILVNHSMTHLEGKTYELRERKKNSKSILIEIGSWSEPQWSEPLVEIKDVPNEVPTPPIQNVVQQTNNGSIHNSQRRIIWRNPLRRLRRSIN